MNSRQTPAHQPHTAAERSRGLTHHRSSLSVFLLAIASFFTLAFGTALAAPQALINGDTVSGGAGSQEAVAATAQGYVVTVVTNATWQTMTQAQFGTYDLLIIGDRAMAEPVRRQDIVRTGVGAAPWAKPESRLSRSYAGTNKSFGYEGVMLAS